MQIPVKDLFFSEKMTLSFKDKLPSVVQIVIDSLSSVMLWQLILFDLALSFF